MRRKSCKVESRVKNRIEQSVSITTFCGRRPGIEEWPSRGGSPLQPPNGLSTGRRAQYVVYFAQAPHESCASRSLESALLCSVQVCAWACHRATFSWWAVAARDRPLWLARVPVQSWAARLLIIINRQGFVMTITAPGSNTYYSYSLFWNLLTRDNNPINRVLTASQPATATSNLSMTRF